MTINPLGKLINPDKESAYDAVTALLDVPNKPTLLITELVYVDADILPCTWNVVAGFVSPTPTLPFPASTNNVFPLTIKLSLILADPDTWNARPLLLTISDPVVRKTVPSN